MNIFENVRQKFLTQTFGLLAIEHLAYLTIMFFSLIIIKDAFQFAIFTNVLLFGIAWIAISYFTQVGALRLNLLGYIGLGLNMIFGGLFYAELSTYIDPKYISMFLVAFIIGFTLLTIIGIITPFDIGTGKTVIDTSIAMLLIMLIYMYLTFPQIYIALGVAISITGLFAFMAIKHLRYINSLEQVQYPEKVHGFIINSTMVYPLTPCKVLFWLWHRFVNLFEYPDSPTRYKR